jgi:O-antigen ligase
MVNLMDKHKLPPYSQWPAIILGLAIPISVAADNILIVLLLAVTVLSKSFYTELARLCRLPVILLALSLFGLLTAGISWSSAPWHANLVQLGKYADLALIPFFAFHFRDCKTRWLALNAFCAAMLITLALSIALYLGLPEFGKSARDPTGSAVVFKFRITHGYLMAFSAYLFGLRAWQSRETIYRWLWSIAAVLAGGNVLFMISGATGYVVFFALSILFAMQQLPRKFWGPVLAFGILSVAIAVNVPGPLGSRIQQVAGEVTRWQPGANASGSSTGERLEYYSNTVLMIMNRPLQGYGTGGFAAAYESVIDGHDMKPTRNPHNEYLLITSQVGCAGLLLLLTLFVVQWRSSPPEKNAFQRRLTQGLVISMAVGCLFNSFLLDHAEGLFYAWMTGLLYGAGLEAQDNPREFA